MVMATSGGSSILEYGLNKVFAFLGVEVREFLHMSDIDIYIYIIDGKDTYTCA